jgi:transcriptional regulator with XRE-family HTH domain
MTFKELGEHISTIRKQKNISQETISQHLGISRATLSSLENGRGIDIGIKKTMKIVEYLGYELELRVKSPFPTFEELRDEK